MEEKVVNIVGYEAPCVLYEGTLEVQAGSPLGDLNDGLDWLEL